MNFRRNRKGQSKRYGNVKVEHDGYKFDSKKERDHYIHLKAMENAGTISHLVVHPKFEFVHDGKKIGKMTPDFQYFIPSENRHVVEDVKNPASRLDTAYRLRRKMMKVFHNIDIEEI